MTSGASIIHTSGFGMNTVLSLFDVLENSPRAVNHDFARINYLRSHHFEITSDVFIWLEKIVQTFLINFEIIHHKLKLSAFFFYGVVHKFKDVPDGSWNNTILTLYLIRNFTTIFDDFYD